MEEVKIFLKGVSIWLATFETTWYYNGQICEHVFPWLFCICLLCNVMQDYMKQLHQTHEVWTSLILLFDLLYPDCSLWAVFLVDIILLSLGCRHMVVGFTNHYPSPLTLRVWSRPRWGVLDTLCNKRSSATWRKSLLQ